MRRGGNVIDLHCHLLPGIDDGAADEAVSLEMARIAVADGICTTACTPHIYPGFYENDRAGIEARVAALQRRLLDEGIALMLTLGADAHRRPNSSAARPALHRRSPAAAISCWSRRTRWRRRGLPRRCSISSPPAMYRF
jgi:hypothetical protein